MINSFNSNTVLLITNIPNPYRIPLFNELDKQLKERELKFKVVFSSFGYSRRKWEIDMSECKFDYIVISSHQLTLDSERSIFTYKRLIKIINEENPVAIITIGFSIATMKLWWRSLFRKTKYIIWSGAIEQKYTTDSLIRRIQRKILIKRAAGFIVYGTKAKQYLIKLGADPYKIYIGINTVDTHFFKNETAKIKKHLKNPEKKILLCIGYLARKKGMDLLFYAIKELTIKRNDFILKIVGDGPEMKNLKDLARELDISHCLVFKGFKQKYEIPNFFSEARCFLFPSEKDIWGLVLVEAMAAGLPCISSIYAGSTFDLIKADANGFAMDFSQAKKVAERINWILKNPESAERIGKKASDFIERNVTIEKSVLGFVQAINKVLD